MSNRTIVRTLLTLLALAVAGCAATSDAPHASSPADKLRKAESGYDLDGELQVTVSRTR